MKNIKSEINVKRYITITLKVSKMKHIKSK